MLKKLKRKFVWINMSLVGLVLLAAFFIVCFNVYEQAKAEVSIALEMAMKDASMEDNMPRQIGIRPEEKKGLMANNWEDFRDIPVDYATVVVSVKETTNGQELNVTERQTAFMQEEITEEAVAAALEAGKNEGKLSRLGLFYMKRDDMGDTKIAFADASYFDSKMKEFILIALCIFLISMVILFLISMLLARMAVVPVKKAWEQQRQFVADASHELKTPLTVILANNEIMLSDVKEGEESRKKWVESNQEEAHHMKKLIDDLLFLTRSDEDAENHRLVKSRVSVSELVIGVALQFEPVVFEAGLSLGTDIEDNLYLECDETRIKQLIHILMDNAVKYSEKHGKIWVDLRRMGGRLHLSVTNTGSVIGQDELDHLFDRFYRVDQARTTGNGYGLGLSIAKTIAEKHGGTITAHSGILNRISASRSCHMPEDVTGTVMVVTL